MALATVASAANERTASRAMVSKYDGNEKKNVYQCKENERERERGRKTPAEIETPGAILGRKVVTRFGENKFVVKK